MWSHTVRARRVPQHGARVCMGRIAIRARSFAVGSGKRGGDGGDRGGARNGSNQTSTGSLLVNLLSHLKEKHDRKPLSANPVPSLLSSRPVRRNNSRDNERPDS